MGKFGFHHGADFIRLELHGLQLRQCLLDNGYKFFRIDYYSHLASLAPTISNQGSLDMVAEQDDIIVLHRIVNHLGRTHSAPISIIAPNSKVMNERNDGFTRAGQVLVMLHDEPRRMGVRLA